jgi:hypothetical protein
VLQPSRLRPTRIDAMASIRCLGLAVLTWDFPDIFTISREESSSERKKVPQSGGRGQVSRWGSQTLSPRSCLRDCETLMTVCAPLSTPEEGLERWSFLPGTGTRRSFVVNEIIRIFVVSGKVPMKLVAKASSEAFRACEKIW